MPYLRKMNCTLANRKVGHLLMISCLLLSFSAAGQAWELKTEEEGIKVYTRPVENSAIKAIKVECTVEASLSQLMAVLLDIPASDEWVYSTKFCRVQKMLSPNELIYHSEIEVPWPVSNRDFVVRIKLEQDSLTKTLTVSGENLPQYLDEQEGVVRIMHTVSHWAATPRDTSVDIVFTLHVDPGGLIPAWLINLFATRGPLETFRNLRSQVKKAEYQDARFPFILE